MVAAVVEAELLLILITCALSQGGQVALGGDGLTLLVNAFDLVRSGHPVDALVDLLADNRHMALEAGGAVGDLVVVGHHGHLGVLVGDVIAPLILVAGGIGLVGRVHGSVADGVAEARLLVPDPEAGASSNDHNDNDTEDDRELLLAALGLLGLGIRGSGLGGLFDRLGGLVLDLVSHGYPPFVVRSSSFTCIPHATWRGALRRDDTDGSCAPGLVGRMRNASLHFNTHPPYLCQKSLTHLGGISYSCRWKTCTCNDFA